MIKKNKRKWSKLKSNALSRQSERKQRAGEFIKLFWTRGIVVDIHRPLVERKPSQDRHSLTPRYKKINLFFSEYRTSLLCRGRGHDSPTQYWGFRNWKRLVERGCFAIDYAKLIKWFFRYELTCSVMLLDFLCWIKPLSTNEY